MIDFEGVLVDVSESGGEGLVLGDVMALDLVLVLADVDEMDSEDVLVVPLY
jgi:hypothetical protein